MTKTDVQNEYFEWLYDLVCKNRYAKEISYRKLLMYLHTTEFVYLIPMDSNRADDGINLRYRFAHSFSDGHVLPTRIIDDYLDSPCSILEMMIALSFRCEEIMDNPTIGDRTSQWFWEMIRNLGLYFMTDDNFDTRYVKEIVHRFLNRDYESNGKGGLFTVRHCDKDLRDVEIWIQLCWYLDTII